MYGNVELSLTYFPLPYTQDHRAKHLPSGEDWRELKS